MKKLVLLFAVAFSFVACNEKTSTTKTTTSETNANGIKTAYIDTEKLMKEYKESSDFEAKYEAMSKRMQGELESDMKKFQSDVADLQKNAQSKGMEWAMNRQKELEKREKILAEKQQNYMKKFQEEGSVERDTMVTRMKRFIKTYGKEKGYDYIFGTGDAATVLYAKDGYDITKEIVEALNKNYETNGALGGNSNKADTAKATTTSTTEKK